MPLLGTTWSSFQLPFCHLSPKSSHWWKPACTPRPLQRFLSCLEGSEEKPCLPLSTHHPSPVLRTQRARPWDAAPSLWKSASGTQLLFWCGANPTEQQSRWHFSEKQCPWVLDLLPDLTPLKSRTAKPFSPVSLQPFSPTPLCCCPCFGSLSFLFDSCVLPVCSARRWQADSPLRVCVSPLVRCLLCGLLCVSFYSEAKWPGIWKSVCLWACLGWGFGWEWCEYCACCAGHRGPWKGPGLHPPPTPQTLAWTPNKPRAESRTEISL